MITDELFSLDGRSALVTGGGRGVGRMIARGLVDRGVRTFICGRDAGVLEATAKDLSIAGGECIALQADLADLRGLTSLAERMTALCPRLDILVNNAALSAVTSFDEISPDQWDKILDVNLKSVFFLTQRLTPLLKAAAANGPSAKVINIASIDGIRVGRVENYAYSASKAGLIHLTKSLALRLIEDRVVVNAIAPGAFPSGMNEMARLQPRLISRHIPSARVGADDDIVGATVYLASRAGDYLVGSTLLVDGGVALAPGWAERRRS